MSVFNRATLLDGQRPPVYLGDALGDDVIRERGELLLQLVEQLHDSDVRAVALPHRGAPSSWQGLPAGARYIIVTCRRADTRWSVELGRLSALPLIYTNSGQTRAKRGPAAPSLAMPARNTAAMTRDESQERS